MFVSAAKTTKADSPGGHEQSVKYHAQNDSVSTEPTEGEQRELQTSAAALQAELITLRSALAIDDPAFVRSVGIHAGDVALNVGLGIAERVRRLEMLARISYDNSQARNEWESLEKALDYLQEALEATDIKQDYARLAVFYSECLSKRYVRSSNPEDLINATEFAVKSHALIQELEDNEENFSLLASATLNHWFCIFLRLELDQSSDPDDDFNLLMKLALEADRLVTDHQMVGSPLAAAKTNLGKSYEMMWERSGHTEDSFEDLIRGLTLGREAVDLAAADELSTALTNLALRLQKAYLSFVLHGHLPPDVSSGYQLLNESIESLAKAQDLPKCNDLDGPNNTLAFILYIRAFPEKHRSEMLGRCELLLRASVATVREFCATSSVNDQRDITTTFYGLSRYAAASVIQNNGDVVDALLLLEAGRNIAATSQGNELQELEAIREVDSQLAERFDIAQKAAKNAFQSSAPYHERLQKLQQLDNLREEMDSVPGIVRPAVTLTRENMLVLASRRDIVIINLTDIRSDAILISRGQIFVVNLPNVNEEELSQRSWEIQTRLAKDKDQEETFSELHQYLSTLLAFLWRNLAQLVLKRLNYTSSISASEDWPHVCWIPSGVLCLYPLHAAGLGLHTERNVINKAISSYASSLSSLWNIHYRDRSNSQPFSMEGRQAYVFTAPETPSMQPLSLSVQEMDAVRSVFPNTIDLTGQTTQDILSTMAAEPAILHFSCHGAVDYDRPLQSMLMTTDWQTDPLTVGRIQLLGLKKPLLAYLSACFTANSGVENQQDESVHLAGAFQLAGFPHVVGSSWYVGEDASLAVVKLFYQRLAQALAGGSSDWSSLVTEALHFAVRDFSHSTRTAANRERGDPTRWAPFMIFGM